MSDYVKYDINRMTGQTLEHVLIVLVEHPHWRDNYTYSFHNSGPKISVLKFKQICEDDKLAMEECKI